MAISPDHIIGHVLAGRPEAARVFLEFGMHCPGCAIAPFETIAEACRTYGVPVGPLIEALESTNRERRNSPRS